MMTKADYNKFMNDYIDDCIINDNTNTNYLVQ